MNRLNCINVCHRYYLRVIPCDIDQFYMVKSIFLNYNNILTIPTEIFNIIDIINLSIGYNRIKSVPNEIGALSELVNLSLEQNYIETLPKELKKLTKLREFYIYNNPVCHFLTPKFSNNLFAPGVMIHKKNSKYVFL